jgi:hypothetical protein
MILIHQESKKSAVKKLQDFYNFYEQEKFNLILGREGLIAAYYFSNKLPDKFIHIQSEMTFSKVRKNLLGTAWDFFLLRIPEIMLIDGTEKETALAYLCSADKAVRKLGRLFTLELVVSLSPELFQPSSISLKLEELKRDLGEDIANILHNQQQGLRERRLVSFQMGKVNPVSTQQLKELISELEEQIKRKCKE